MSQPDHTGTLVAISLLRLYSNEVIGLGPGPLRRGGAIVATHWKGREMSSCRPRVMRHFETSAGSRQVRSWRIGGRTPRPDGGAPQYFLRRPTWNTSWRRAPCGS
jgi:hypothetical protein